MKNWTNFIENSIIDNNYLFKRVAQDLAQTALIPYERAAKIIFCFMTRDYLIVNICDDGTTIFSDDDTYEDFLTNNYFEMYNNGVVFETGELFDFIELCDEPDLIDLIREVL